MTNFFSSLSCWNFLTNFFYYRRTILDGDVKRNFNLNISAHFFWFVMTNLFSDGTERWNAFCSRYVCAMRNFDVVRYFDWYFVAIAFNFNLTGWSTSKKRKGMVVALSVPTFIL